MATATATAPEGSGGFGFGGAAGNSWDLGNSQPDGSAEGGDGAGKARQEPGSAGMHPESEGLPGRGYPANPDRYDPYESYGDSRCERAPRSVPGILRLPRGLSQRLPQRLP
ncbi:uncharacterized protein VK521_015230 [Ammospiza maritima maritima]